MAEFFAGLRAWVSSFLVPPNALILFYDHLSEDDPEELSQVLETIGRHYEFVPLRSLIREFALKGAWRGKAAVAFRYPRKSIWFRARPALEARHIPFTIFLRPDCIGLNRLPPHNEWELFCWAYPTKAAELKQDPSFLKRSWNEEVLVDLRRKWGPLPLSDMDGLFFFETWGRLRTQGQGGIDWGLVLDDAASLASVERDTQEIERQLSLRPDVFLRDTSKDEVWDHLRKGGNVLGAVHPKEGVIHLQSEVSCLPVWEHELSTKTCSSLGLLKRPRPHLP